MKFKTSVRFFVLVSAILSLAVFANAQICPAAPGCLDPRFNGTGTQVIVTAGNGATPQTDAVVQSDGKIISLIDNRTTQATMVRLNADGTLDSSFGASGIVTTNWHYPNGFAYGLAIQIIAGQERLVVVGSCPLQQGQNTITALRVDRYMPDGSIDTSFGTNGSSVVNADYALAVAIQPADQKIVTVGDLGTMVRLTADGTLDNSFGSGGKSAIGQEGWSIKVLANGKIVVSGTASSGSSSPMAVMQFNANGNVDNTFGTRGRALANFYGSGSFGRAFRVDTDGFGHIIAGGIARAKHDSISQNKFAAARFTSNGLLDSSFSRDGMVTYDFAGLNNNGRSIAAQALDGKIVLTGSADLSSTARDFAAVRFNYDGTVDTTFGNRGRVTTDFGGMSEYSYSVRMWTDPLCSCEKIIMAGSTNVGAAFLRYTTTNLY